MGVVYRGTDLTLKREVAIKALRASDADSTVLARFMREARSLASVEHPGLVQVYAVSREGGVYYLVMKFVEGRTLSAVLKAEGALAPNRVRQLVSDICDALGALHEAGLIHRDIKPGNVMVGSDERTTVMDLGIVKSVGEHTETTSGALGTPRYMPPEMLGDDPVDARADLYSLAVIAYQALTGDPPFDGPTPMAVLYKQAHEPPERLRKRAPGVPRNLAKAVERALEKRPDDRFEDAAAFAAAVQEDAVLPARTRRRWLPVAGVTAAAAAAAVVWWLASPPPPSPTSDAGGAVVVVVGGDSDKAKRLQDRPNRAPVPDASVPPDAAPAVQSVTIQVRSDPAGANVYAGSRRLGTTPFKLRRPQANRTLTLTLKRQGYSPKKLRVSLRASGAARARLEPIFELVP